jgi:hypothetical protein
MPTPAIEANCLLTPEGALNRTTGSDVMTFDLFNTGSLDRSGTKIILITVVTFGSSNAAAVNFALKPVNFAFSGTLQETLNTTSLVVQFVLVPEPGFVQLMDRNLRVGEPTSCVLRSDRSKLLPLGSPPVIDPNGIQ